MDRDTGTTKKPITSASAFRLSILAWPFSDVFSIRTCTDIYRHPCIGNNDGILATNGCSFLTIVIPT